MNHTHNKPQSLRVSTTAAPQGRARPEVDHKMPPNVMHKLVGGAAGLLALLYGAGGAHAASGPHGGEASLVLPDFASVSFLGMSGKPFASR